MAACLLVLINLLFFDLHLKPSPSIWANRAITAYIAVHYQKLSRSGVLKKKEYLRALEEMLFMTSHEVRKPVANLLGLLDIITNESAGLSVEKLRLRCGLLSTSADELDVFVRKLNTFIEHTEKQSHKATRDQFRA